MTIESGEKVAYPMETQENQKRSAFTVDEFEQLMVSKLWPSGVSKNDASAELFGIMLSIALSAYPDRVLVEFERRGFIPPNFRFCCMRHHKYSAQECVERVRVAYKDAFAKQRGFSK
jgi:hypothetical protein